MARFDKWLWSLSLWLKSCVFLSVSACTDGGSCWPLFTLIYLILVFVPLFDFLCFLWLWNYWCKLCSPTVFYLPLYSYLWKRWKSCQEESSSCKDRVGGLSCSSLSLLQAFCIPDAFRVRWCTFKIFLLKVGSLLTACSSSIHHSLVIIPLSDTCKKEGHKNTNWTF